ncbi:ThuA domain-containing protein [Paenibacillus sp. PAMC21692]|uniref:ThuA domain-containing protein n=1 Tax=Paenibacillus sp. PAMC21692 TaxID=2762320 RepID=UPI00164E374D|nr:ThuA domain-containing protein [Paenibacillus sp. PAMC21692]QNK58988.1 ThuA domain-containing protein [Paenibacillus sp. PAMC21692]
MTTLKVTIWNEYRHERLNEHVAGIYPRGIHNAIGDYLLKAESVEVTTATLDEPEHGLTEEVLANTDVLLWWGHLAHGEVRDDIVEKVRDRVLDGMGLIVLHSGHASKIFERLLGTKTGTLKWRDDGERERVWVIESGHPIAEGLGDYFEIPKEEMYGERFEIPTPDELVFISWFEGGEVFRSGCTYRRGRGKIFYFRPGHETFPVYHQSEVLKVIGNAVRWAAPTPGAASVAGRTEPIERIGVSTVK